MGWRRCQFCGEEVYWAYVLPPNEYSRRWVAFEDEDLSECHFDLCPGRPSRRLTEWKSNQNAHKDQALRVRVPQKQTKKSNAPTPMKKEGQEDDISCPSCNRRFPNKLGLVHHISVKHPELWKERINSLLTSPFEFMKTNPNLKRCEKCGMLVRDLVSHEKQCSKQKRRQKGGPENYQAGLVPSGCRKIGQNQNKDRGDKQADN